MDKMKDTFTSKSRCQTDNQENGDKKMKKFIRIVIQILNFF